MGSFLSNMLKTLFGESIARALGGAGLSLASAALLLPLIVSGLNLAAQAVGSVPGDILNVALLGGIGEVMTILGTAMLTRIAFNSTKLGLKKAAGA